jgi:hypothetical protein
MILPAQTLTAFKTSIALPWCTCHPCLHAFQLAVAIASLQQALHGILLQIPSPNLRRWTVCMFFPSLLFTNPQRRQRCKVYKCAALQQGKNE